MKSSKKFFILFKLNFTRILQKLRPSLFDDDNKIFSLILQYTECIYYPKAIITIDYAGSITSADEFGGGRGKE